MTKLTLPRTTVVSPYQRAELTFDKRVHQHHHRMEDINYPHPTVNPKILPPYIANPTLKLPKDYKTTPGNQTTIHFPPPLLIISLYLIMESILCNFNCCLNLLMKSSALESTPSSSSSVNILLPSLTVAGRRASTTSFSSKLMLMS